MAEEDNTASNKKRTSSPGGDEPPTKRRPENSSSSDINWDVEECRGDHESVEHWELRKQFLLQNMGRFPKSRMICLSQVFANMEFLGCRYPEETMELVHELSAGIVEEYREKQKNRLQRTFVKASDAAERKTKGSNCNRNSGLTNNGQDRASIKSVSSSTISELITSTRHTEESSFSTQDQQYPDLKNLILLIFTYNTGENAVSIIHRSCSAAHISISAEFSEDAGNHVCTYSIGKYFTACSDEFSKSKESAKNSAAKLAFKRLQKICYTFVTKLKVLPDDNGKEIAKHDVDGEQQKEKPSEAISEDNIGNKLLKLMGWTGGGLGKNQQGIHESISVDGVVGRSRMGLGNEAGVSFQKKIKELLEEHQRLGFPYDLKFSADFSKDERKEIHMVSQRLGLKSKSFGKDDDRYIVVSEKVSRKSLLENTLSKGGETEKYCVVPPGGNFEKLKEFIS